MLCAFLKIMNNCNIDFKYSTIYSYKTDNQWLVYEYMKINNSILFCIRFIIGIAYENR